MQEIYISKYSHRHGTDINVFEDIEDAKAYQLEEVCEQRLNNMNRFEFDPKLTAQELLDTWDIITDYEESFSIIPRSIIPKTKRTTKQCNCII